MNGVGGDEAARTSRALLAYAFGDATTLNVGLVFGAFVLAPVVVADLLVAWAWSALGYAKFPVLVLVVVATTVAVVATVAVDGSVRGRLLRTARGDGRALPTEFLARVVYRPATA